jgi:hypothetical protein
MAEKTDFYYDRKTDSFFYKWSCSPQRWNKNSIKVLFTRQHFSEALGTISKGLGDDQMHVQAVSLTSSSDRGDGDCRTDRTTAPW